MTRGNAPRLLLAGACFLLLSWTELPGALAQASGAEPKREAKKPKAKAKSTPKAKSTKAAAKKTAARQPAWGSMPPAKPLAFDKIPQRAVLTPSEAAARHRAGLQAERAGDEQGAFRAYRDAAEAGHGPAQAKLGEIYDRGNSAVDRDYATALGWYQKAREQGVTVPKPHTFPAGR